MMTGCALMAGIVMVVAVCWVAHRAAEGLDILGSEFGGYQDEPPWTMTVIPDIPVKAPDHAAIQARMN